MVERDKLKLERDALIVARNRARIERDAAMKKFAARDWMHRELKKERDELKKERALLIAKCYCRRAFYNANAPLEMS